MRTSATGATGQRWKHEANQAGNRPSPSGDSPAPGSSQRIAYGRCVSVPTSVAQPTRREPLHPVPDNRPISPATGDATAPSVRSRLSLSDRNWNSDRPQQIPCWLASLLLHMLAVVVLGSVTVPVSRQRTIMSLLLSFGDVTAQQDEPLVELASTQSLTEEPPNEQELGAQGFEEIEAAPLSQMAASLVPPLPQEHTAEPVPDQPLASAAGGSPGTAPPNTATRGQTDATHGEANQEHTVAVADRQDDEVERQNNQIVDQFIRFDIGQLNGQAGIKARDDFQKLGPRALAALVRGLNKSASIRASCPVMVITYKIESVLRENHDPALLQYAVENIGRDVPLRAPHFAHIQNLVEKLRLRDPENSSPNVTMILAQLQQGQQQQVLNAAEVVMTGGDKFLEFEKRQVAWALIRYITHRDPKLRRAARQALVTLADGTDLGPTHDQKQADRLEAAAKWSLHFDADRFEAAAEGLLKTARHLEDAGKRTAARRYFTKVVDEYRGTAAADEAADLLEEQKAFALK
ncbi:MAG TPA: hypothetical protein VHC22_09635 [Pirellulales bacterium]|nr:hypothetical protein [Pirellulales bacterium]